MNEEDERAKSRAEENINSAKIGEVDADTLIAGATILMTAYQTQTGQIVWKSNVSDTELEDVLNVMITRVRKHNILNEAVAASLKAIESTYRSNLFGPDGKPILNVS